MLFDCKGLFVSAEVKDIRDVEKVPSPSLAATEEILIRLAKSVVAENFAKPEPPATPHMQVMGNNFLR